MNVDTIADELYGLPPNEFTSTRNDRARAARVAGERALAEQVRGLRKPTAVAWLANQVVRHHHDLIELLLELGQEMQAVMAAPSGQDLRRLNAQQRGLVQAVQQAASELARSAGHPATDEILRGMADTFRAALADPQAAETLAAGRLTEALIPAAFAGFQPTSGPAEQASAPSPRPAAPHREGDELGAVRKKRAEQALVEAQDRAKAARHALKHAKESRDRASSRSRKADERVEQLRAELAGATADRESAKQAADSAISEHERADIEAREADQHLDEARAAVASSGTPDDAGLVDDLSVSKQHRERDVAR